MKINKSRPWHFLIGILSLLVFWQCNVTEKSEIEILNLVLHDSLTVEGGKYDKIKVDILTVNDVVFKEAIYDAPFSVAQKGRLSDLEVGENAPNPYRVRISGFLKGETKLVFIFDITNGQAQPLKIIVFNPGAGVVPADTVVVRPTDTVPEPPVDTVVNPTEVRILNGSQLTLVENGSSLQLNSLVLPEKADQNVTWTTEDALIAAVDANGNLKPGKIGKTTVWVASKVDPALKASTIIDVITAPKTIESIKASPKTLHLFTGGQTGKINAVISPADAGNVASFASDDAGIAQVNASGTVTPVSPGSTFILASVVGFPSVTDTVLVKVETDIPQLQVSADQKVLFGQEVKFDIKVTQNYGGIEVLRWDFEDDGVWDGQTKDSVVTIKKTYTTRGTFTVRIHVKDTEGNENTVTRRALIDTNEPLVEILDPSKDTLINKTSLKISYRVDNGPLIDSTVSNLKEGSNTVTVSKTTEGGTGTASVKVTVDTTPPKVVITSPTAGQKFNTLSVPVTWTVDGVVQTTQNNQTLSGTDGEKTITRSFTDAAGNSGSASVKIQLIRTGPPAPTVKAEQTPTRNTKPTWTWTSGGGGSGKYRYRIANGSTPTGNGTAIELKSYTPGSALLDGSWHFQAQESDELGNWGNWSTVVIIEVKSSAPAKPSVQRNAAVTNSPAWTWSGTGGGNGTFRYRWSSSAAGTYIQQGVQSTRYAPTNLSDGEHTLCVSERDVIGYGDQTCISLEVDKTPPKITEVSLANNHVTSKSTITVTWKEEGETKSRNENLIEGKNTITITAKDEAGNVTTVTRTCFRRSNVVFVKQGGLGGGTSGDGTSWATPLATIAEALSSSRLSNYPNGTQIWVTAGNYSTPSELFLKSNISLFGGFSASNPEDNTNSRQMTANRTVWTVGLHAQLNFSVDLSLNPNEVTKNVEINGFDFISTDQGIWIAKVESMVIRNCRFRDAVNGGIVLSTQETVGLIFDNIDLINNKGVVQPPITFYAGTNATIINSSFIGNSSGYYSGAIHLYADAKLKILDSKFQNNVDESSGKIAHIYLEFTSSVDYSNCQIQGLDNNTIYGEPSTTIIRGPNNTNIP